MPSEIFEKTDRAGRSVTVEQHTADLITVKTKLRNMEYVVDMPVFKKEDIDELLGIQNDIYNSVADSSGLKEKLLSMLRMSWATAK